MLHISLKNTSGWGLLMKQHSYFPHEKDKHSHKGGIFCQKNIFSINLLQLLMLGHDLSATILPSNFQKHLVRTAELHQSLVCFMEKPLKRKHPLNGVLWKSLPENFQSWQLMLNMNSPTVAFLGISRKHIWQDPSVERYYNHCFTYITDNKKVTKPTFRPSGRPDKSTICSHSKNAETYWKTNAQRGWVSD